MFIFHRSSHHRCSIEKGVLKQSTKCTGKHLCQSLFLIKVSGLRPATLLKKRLWQSCFPVHFVNCLRTSFLQNTSWRLLLFLCYYHVNYNYVNFYIFDLKKQLSKISFSKSLPANIYLFKVNNRNTRKRCKICSKLTIKTAERRH